MNNLNTSPTSSKKIKLDFKDSKYATGRRKKSIAKVWVKKGSGKIYVNGKVMADYFKRPWHVAIRIRGLVYCIRYWADALFPVLQSMGFAKGTKRGYFCCGSNLKATSFT